MMTVQDQARFTNTVAFQGPVSVPPSSFGDTEFNNANPLTAAKQQHQYRPRLSQAHGTNASNERRVVHVAKANGSVVDFVAGVTVAAVGDSEVSVDLLKNGTSILDDPVEVTAGDEDDVMTGTIASGQANYVTGDVFEIRIISTAGTGTPPQGAYGQPTFREAA